jgi:60S ribosomal subunit assembly/export protein LOC1
MAPAPTTKSNKAPTRGGKSGPSKSVGPSKGGAGKPSSSKIRKGSTSSSAKKPQGQVSGEQKKTKSANSHGQANKKKKKVYTAAELGIPELNGITPEGVTKPPNMKKGKNFVDDNEGMAAIMAMVMAEKDGNIESKMQKARHLEELREAKKAEAEKRAQSKKETFEGRMENIKAQESVKRKRGGKIVNDADEPESRKSMKNGHFKGFGNDEPLDKKPSRKRVSFG